MKEPLFKRRSTNDQQAHKQSEMSCELEAHGLVFEMADAVLSFLHKPVFPPVSCPLRTLPSQATPVCWDITCSSFCTAADLMWQRDIMGKFRTTGLVLVVTSRAWEYSNCVKGRQRKRRQCAHQGRLWAQEDMHRGTLHKQWEEYLRWGTWKSPRVWQNISSPNADKSFLAIQAEILLDVLTMPLYNWSHLSAVITRVTHFMLLWMGKDFLKQFCLSLCSHRTKGVPRTKLSRFNIR